MYSITGQRGPHVKTLDGTDAARVDGRTRRWEEHRQKRHEDLLRQVRRVVHQNGPDLSMEEIARHLGTSKSILYRYFKDKVALQSALGEYVLGRAGQRLSDAASTSRDPRRAIAAMVESYVEAVERSTNVFLFVNLPGAATESHLSAFIGRVEEIVGEMLRTVTPETPTARVAIWAAGIVGLVRSAVWDWVHMPDDGRPSRAELTSDLTSILWDGTHRVLRTTER